MTDPRRPDDTRLSTADLAAATDRPVERDVTREVQQGHANVVADAARRFAVTVPLSGLVTAVVSGSAKSQKLASCVS